MYFFSMDMYMGFKIFILYKFSNISSVSNISFARFILTMLEEDLEIAIKVVVVGNGAVGKSSMIQRYCKGVFTQDYKKTIGVDFLEREIE